MSNLNVLHVWDGLELAKNKIHPYGGDMLEVFAQHFVSDEPDKDQWIQAGYRLYVMLCKFAQCNNVIVLVNGKKIGDWMHSYRFFHKCDIRIVVNESVQSEGIGSEEALQENGEGYNLFGTSKETGTNSEDSKTVFPVLQPEQSEKLLGELESCKIDKPKRSIVKRLPGLLKNLLRTISSRQSRRTAG